MRTIAIVGGTGPQGAGLALRWARAGERIVIGSRDGARAQQTADAISARCDGDPQVSGAENPAAVAQADVVVLTVPFSVQAGTLKQLKPHLRPGTVLIDTTVPLASTVGGRATRTLTVWEGSAAQQAASLAPKEVSVVAAFQNIGSDALNSDKPVECDVIICTDDERARAVAAELAAMLPGARAVDGGRLENARIVEQITALLITINTRHKAHAAGIRITGLDVERKRNDPSRHDT